LVGQFTIRGTPAQAAAAAIGSASARFAAIGFSFIPWIPRSSASATTSAAARLSAQVMIAAGRVQS